ncbi:MscL family protein [Naumannella cuiyingiana]|uniref:Large conductance mechanosensitive channel n=1 Tax=Naumannella cuiyingiana TaxID=1347891 RepID=A0A7Z0ILK7_9ACTN|nr:MscL family protein [Naumannella cuiyingiana]NYI71688.1 large conductance mechanosensitive channel [Naumannella cuiyingiana]
MKGFKDFLMQGNLIELAVAFIMASAFGAVVTAFTTVVMDLIGLIIGTPEFSSVIIGGVNVGPLLTAAVNFLLIAGVVYFGIVKPYEAYKARTAKPEPEEIAEDELKLLGEIRDLLAGR